MELLDYLKPKYHLHLIVTHITRYWGNSLER
jgi:hypothetical protein